MPLVARSDTREVTLCAALLAVDRISMRSFSTDARRLLMSLPHGCEGAGRLCFMALVYQYDERYIAMMMVSAYSYSCQQGIRQRKEPT